MKAIKILLALLLLLSLTACSEKKTEKDVKIAQLEGQVLLLQEKLANCQQQAGISPAVTDYSAPKTAEQPTRATTTPRTRATTSPKKVTPAASPAPTRVTEGTEAPAPTRTNIDHLLTNGQAVFCIMANNSGRLHFPQYGLERGARFNGAVSNITGDGSNWAVGPRANIEGDYGVLFDGTFFIRHQAIASVLNVELKTLAIKTKGTSWQPREMSRIGDFWIIKL